MGRAAYDDRFTLGFVVPSQVRVLCEPVRGRTDTVTGARGAWVLS